MSEPLKAYPSSESREDQKDERASRQLEQIRDDLADADKTSRARMLERNFVLVYLPLFAGDPPEQQHYGANIRGWTNYAGGAYKEVDIVDSAGNVLYVVPPMFEREAVQAVTEEGGRGIASIVANTQQLAGLSPRQAAAYLESELTKKALIMKVPVSVLKNVQTWNDIFKRYGRKPMFELDATAASGAVGAAPAAKLDNYDDFEPL